MSAGMWSFQASMASWILRRVAPSFFLAASMFDSILSVGERALPLPSSSSAFSLVRSSNSVSSAFSISFTASSKYANSSVSFVCAFAAAKRTFLMANSRSSISASISSISRSSSASSLSSSSLSSAMSSSSNPSSKVIPDDTPLAAPAAPFPSLLRLIAAAVASSSRFMKSASSVACAMMSSTCSSSDLGVSSMNRAKGGFGSHKERPKLLKPLLISPMRSSDVFKPLGRDLFNSSSRSSKDHC
mmetsp:Transcript_15728/g.43437  ORF Transcript_15728/g.43437 Transcript_15728/m.43437 type:complete len:244 (-) Transcript_15728:669-1400(-)